MTREMKAVEEYRNALIAETNGDRSTVPLTAEQHRLIRVVKRGRERLASTGQTPAPPGMEQEAVVRLLSLLPNEGGLAFGTLAHNLGDGGWVHNFAELGLLPDFIKKHQADFGMFLSEGEDPQVMVCKASVPHVPLAETIASITAENCIERIRKALPDDGVVPLAQLWQNAAGL
eukprot:NODE_1858_length_1584_cov_111.121150_g1768_i0.p1 GENE.NODE_1858_length_1584_cov_111.121150_g1768_i0~~NODE_1858_length_1584_cov_111.121150_g1768_i0.p1  ORF type:complete len:174 (+),score=34.27 NODE_1858_length_1584_cov_111.121150_g1768_i0:487-1008(+)